MQSGVEVAPATDRRTLWAKDIARIMWGVDLSALSVTRQAGCHQVAHYTQRLFDGLEESVRDEAPKR
jgi:hypothetical protein